MATVFLSIGSNISPQKNIRFCLQQLKAAFAELSLSSTYESVPVGFRGDNFYNLVAQVTTNKSISELALFCRHLEAACGRDRSQAKFSSRSLDVDILTYDDYCGVFDGVQLPREEILRHAFVLLPLAELAPLALHPVHKKSYAALWQQFDQGDQALWIVDLP